ncbi:MAG: mechanosensitive ion channel family protein, partial [Gammaproteobacteria bacterium]
IIIPNGQVMDGKIVNYTEAEVRRMDLEVGIGYGDSIDKAREALLAALPASEYVLDEPATKVTVASLGDSSVNLAVRPYVKSATYAPASHEITERIKKALDEAGVSIPFPQRDVHLIKED